MAKKETYEQSINKLEQIASQIENNELDIDQLSGKLKEAQELIKTCREKDRKSGV